MSGRVTRDHHNMRRTVSLNGNKISNDGGDEGISVADNGNVTVSGELDIDGAKITSAGALEIDPGGQLSVTGQDMSLDSTKKVIFGDAGEYVVGDGTNLNITSSQHVLINSTTGDTKVKIGDGDDSSRFEVEVHAQGVGALFAVQGEASAESVLYLYEGGGVTSDDYLKMSVGAHGATTISTVDASAAAAHLTLDPDGDLIISGADTKIDSSKKVIFGDTGEYIVGDGTDLDIISSNDLTLDAGNDIIIDSASGITHFYDAGDTDDAFKITVVGGTGATTLETVSAAADGHLSVVADGHVEFDGCGVGFDLVTPTYNASDTEVNFKTGNKQFVTFGSGNIADLNLKFPTTSGNFTLLLKQDGTGSRTVAADGWLVFDSAGNAANGSSTVKFPGGTNPTLTTAANHVDIISFFWDADNEIAYGVASLDFQD